MDLVLIELVLWVGLLFFFWALKEGLGHVESDIESFGLLQNARRSILRDRGRKNFDYPEHLEEPIGSYCDVKIYRYAIIRGRVYQFDRVCPPESHMTVGLEECYLEPGLIYQPCPIHKLPER